MLGKRVGGFKRRAEEIITGDLSIAPELVPIFEALIKARRDILARIKALDSQIRTVVRRHKPVQLLMTAPGLDLSQPLPCLPPLTTPPASSDRAAPAPISA